MVLILVFVDFKFGAQNLQHPEFQLSIINKIVILA